MRIRSLRAIRNGYEARVATAGELSGGRSPLDKAKRWLETGAKTTALVVVPLAAISVSGQTNAFGGMIFDPTSATFSAASGGAFQSTSGFNSLPSFNSITGATAFGNAQYDVSDVTSTGIQFTLSGHAGDGSTPFAVSTVPISWNFTFTPESSGDTWTYYELTNIYTSNSSGSTQTFQQFGSYVGQASITDSMNAATPLGLSMTDWDTSLIISWQSANASGGAGSGVLNWDIPSATSLDVNFAGTTSVPEPSGWHMAIPPLLVGLGLFFRRRRRGDNEAV